MVAAAAEVGCDEQRAILTDDSPPCYRGPEREGPNVTEEQKESKASQMAHKQVQEIHHAPVTSRLPFAPDHGAAAARHPQPDRAGPGTWSRAPAGPGRRAPCVPARHPAPVP